MRRVSYPHKTGAIQGWKKKS